MGDTVAGGVINPFFGAEAPYKMLILKPTGTKQLGAEAFILTPHIPHALTMHMSYSTTPPLTSPLHRSSVGPFGFIVVLYDVHTLTELQQKQQMELRFVSVCVDAREWEVPCDLVRETRQIQSRKQKVMKTGGWVKIGFG